MKYQKMKCKTSRRLYIVDEAPSPGLKVGSMFMVVEDDHAQAPDGDGRLQLQQLA